MWWRRGSPFEPVVCFVVKAVLLRNLIGVLGTGSLTTFAHEATCLCFALSQSRSQARLKSCFFCYGMKFASLINVHRHRGTLKFLGVKSIQVKGRFISNDITYLALSLWVHLSLSPEYWWIRSDGMFGSYRPVLHAFKSCTRLLNIEGSTPAPSGKSKDAMQGSFWVQIVHINANTYVHLPLGTRESENGVRSILAASFCKLVAGRLAMIFSLCEMQPVAATLWAS